MRSGLFVAVVALCVGVLVMGDSEVCRVRDLPKAPALSYSRSDTWDDSGPCARHRVRPLPPQGPFSELGEDVAVDEGQHKPCPPQLHTVSQMMLALHHASFDCTNTIAVKLGPEANPAVVNKLMDLASNSPSSWTRRNGLRVLGQFCWSDSNCQSPEGDGCKLKKACRLLLRDEKVKFQNFLEQRVKKEESPMPMDDALWITSSYFPTLPGLKARYLAIARNSSIPQVTLVRAQELWNQDLANQNSYSSEDISDLLRGLSSTDDTTIQQYSASSQYVFATASKKQKETITTKLTKLFNNMSALGMETQLGVASALDRFTGTSQHTYDLKQRVHAKVLANSVGAGPVTVSSSLPEPQLQCFLALVQRETVAFHDILGQEFSKVLPHSSSADHVKLYVFPTNQDYRSYMQAFVGFAVNAGGLYVSQQRTLFTYQRTAETSYISVEELILHEFGHYLQSRYILPGKFGEGDYAAQSKGWMDEGMADFWGGLNFDSRGCYSMPLRMNYIKRICAAQYKTWNLHDLLTRRKGYDQPGVFEYKHAYTFAYFLATQHLDVLKKVLIALKEQRYEFSKWEEITGVSIKALNQGWHEALDSYCDEYKKPVNERATHTPVCPQGKPVDDQSSCTVKGHGFKLDHELGEGLVDGTEVDEREMHVGTDFEDLLGPEADFSSMTTSMSRHHDDIVNLGPSHF